MLQYGESALHKAALSDHVEAIELIVKHGAAVDIRNKVLLLYVLNNMRGLGMHCQNVTESFPTLVWTNSLGRGSRWRLPRCVRPAREVHQRREKH